MKETELRTYKDDIPASSIRRMEAFLIDGIIFIILSFLLIISGFGIFSTTNKYQQNNQTINDSMIACYRIEEEAKVYEFDDNYTTPRNQEDIFYDYCLRHILYSYQKDPSSFIKNDITIDNENLEAASYESDSLAYFYAIYCEKYNSYNDQENDLVDFGSRSPKQYFYHRFKAHNMNISLWVLDEENYTLPYLTSSAAADLYLYLHDSSYKTGLTIYNYIAVTYQNLWNEQVDILINSSRFQYHYSLYKNAYKECSYIVDVIIVISFLLSFFSVVVLPQILLKDGQTVGKKLIKIKVVDIEGYKVSKKQLIARNIFMLFEYFGLMIISCFLSGGLNSGWMYPFIEINGVGFSMFSIMCITLILSIISMIIMMVTKKKRAAEDLIASTMCIDLRYHLTVEEEKEIIESDLESEKKEYFDSSSFNNPDYIDKNIK